MNMENFKFNGYEQLELNAFLWETEIPSAVLLIVHGFGEHAERYAELAAFLNSSGIAVMSFDLRGHGRSEGKQGLILDWNEFHKDIDAAVKVLGGKYPSLPLFLMGHSLGGTMVLEYVLSSEFQPRGIIVSAPSLGAPGISKFLLAISKFLSFAAPRMIISTGLNSDAMSRDKKEVEKYLNDPLIHDKASPRLGTELEKVQNFIHENSENLTVPMLLVYGSGDTIAPHEPINRFFNNAGAEDKLLKVFDGAYHELHNDLVKEEVYKLYTDWLVQRA